MAEEKKERFVKFFNMMDGSGNGSLTIEELDAGLREHCGLEKTPDEVAEMFCGCDASGDMKVSLEEFLDQVLYKLPKNEAIKANLNIEFKKMDKDSSGYLDSGEVRNLFQSLGIDGLTDDQIDSYIAEADSSGDGKVSLSELNALLSQ